MGLKLVSVVERSSLSVVLEGPLSEVPLYQTSASNTQRGELSWVGLNPRHSAHQALLLWHVYNTKATVVSQPYLCPCLSSCWQQPRFAVFLLSNPLCEWQIFKPYAQTKGHRPGIATLNFPLVPKLPSIVPTSPAHQMHTNNTGQYKTTMKM